MKFTKFLLIFLFAFTINANAQNYVNNPSKSPYVLDYFAKSSTAVSTTLGYVIIPALGADSKPLFEFINSTSDKAASVITIREAGAVKVTSASSPSGAAVINTPGTGQFAGTEVIVIYDPATGLCERLVLTSVATSTITATSNLVNTYGKQSQVYAMTSVATLPNAAATKQIDRPFYVGLKGKPTLIETDSTTVVSKVYLWGVYTRSPL